MNVKFIAAFVAIILIGVAGFVFLGRSNSSTAPQTTTDGKMSVVASFYPVYFFASEIGGEKANVRNLTPAGVEPHDFEPSPQDLVAIQKADLVVFNGSGLEPWVERLLPLDTQVVLVSEGLASIEGGEHEHADEHEKEGAEHQEGGEHHDEEAEEHGDEHHNENEHHDEHGLDPHVWLSPVLAAKMVEAIAQGFAQADPENAAYYADNARALKERLTTLDTAYREGLAVCDTKNVVVSHAAFAYLVAAYDLNQVPIAGLSPDEEPSAQELAEIVRFARDNDVQYIFFESLVSPKLSETIAREVGAETLVLDPIEGITQEELAAGETYISLMERNLANLKTALRCTR